MRLSLPLWLRETAKDVLVALAVALVLRASVADARVVPTPSMVPTVYPGDRVFMERVVLRFTGVDRGDIVVFQPPFETTDPYLKRVIGLPGETVEVRKGQVLIDGVALDEPYLKEAPRYTYGPVTIPEDKLLVLGDNRNDSYDSHSWGLLDRDAVEGRAWFRYWPMNRIGGLD